MESLLETKAWFPFSPDYEGNRDGDDVGLEAFFRTLDSTDLAILTVAGVAILAFLAIVANRGRTSQGNQ